MTIPPGGIVCFLDERDDRQSMLVGGYYIPRSALKLLDDATAKVKSDFGISVQDPAKWNLRDPACERAREAIGPRVDEFRESMFKVLRPLGVRLIMSLVWKGDPSYTAEAWQWALENILQRLCIILDRKRTELHKPHEYPFLDVVFDWLPGAKRVDDYLRLYSDAYYHGYQFIKNKLPALRESEACPCMLVASARHSPALQMADMLVGCVGDFFTWVFEAKREASVRRHFVSIYDLFHRGDGGSVLGRGLIVKANTRRRIAEKLAELGLAP